MNLLLAGESDDLTANFASPPDSAAPRTWWHWMNGNVTKEGVTADLEAMHRVGIRSATIVIVGLGAPAGPIHFRSPSFFAMVKFAASEAKRLGMTIGLENCAGWSSSGGPWVTPENSMQEVVSSEKNLVGPSSFSGFLPQPEKRMNYYRDIRVVAFPKLEGDDFRMTDLSPTITASAPDFLDPQSHDYRLPYATANNPQYLQFEFRQPIQVRTVRIGASLGNHGQGDIEASDDNQKFRAVRSFVLRFDGGTYAIAPTTARIFRIVFTKTEGRHAAMEIPLVDLLTASRLDDYLMKCDGAGDRMNNNEFNLGNTPTPPDRMVIHPDKMIDLTSKMDSTGKLTWNVPDGKWTVLRFGYTTNGTTNRPAPPEGTGLECDKLSRAAARTFWDGLLTKVTRDLGPLTGTTFTHTLIDSYEVGGQNWSPQFAEDFQKRRGYDLLPYLPVCRVFRHYTGKTVIKYLIERRIQAAVWKLRESDEKIISIALSCGFNDIAYFNRIFKRIMARTPSQYRKTLRRNSND